jgi:hypothetical protein
MSDWDDYLSRIAELDKVRREAAATVAAQELAVHAAQTALGGVRHRIAIQRTRLNDTAARLARPLPEIEPLDDERGAASAVVASVTSDPTPGINAALQGARATLDAADATLSAAMAQPVQSGPLPDWPPVARNALVYGWFAFLAVVVLVAIHATAGSSPAAGVVQAFFALAVPVGAWLVGVASVALLFGRAGSGAATGRPVAKHPKHLLLGAAICVVPVLIGLFLSFG